MTTAMTVISAAANYAFRLVVLSELPGKEAAGIYAVTVALLSIGSSLGDFGLNATIMPRIAMARGADTPVLRAALMMRLVTIALTWIGLNVYMVASGKTGLIGYVNVGFAGVFISARLTGVRQGLELLWRVKGRAWVAAAFTVFDSLLGLAVVAIVAQTSQLTVGIVTLVWTVTSIPGFLLLFVPLVPMLRAAERLRRPVPRRYYRRLFFATLPVGLMAFAGQVSGQLETFVLDWFGSLADVGAYNVAVSPLMGLVFVPVSVSVGLSPLVTQIFRGLRSDISMELMMSLAIRMVLVVALCAAVTTNVFAGEIMSVFGAEYAGETYILRTYTAIMVLVFFIVATDQYLLAAGYRKQVLFGALLHLGLAIALEIPLVRQYGIEGMMAAKITAMVATIVYQLSVFRRDMRSGALHGLVRLVGPVAVFVGTFMLAADWPLAARAALVIPAVGASLLLFGAIRRTELVQLRGLRLS